MPAKGTYQEFIHSHPTPISVQVMPSVRLSSQAWTQLLYVCVMLPSPPQQPPCLPHPVSQGVMSPPRDI